MAGLLSSGIVPAGLVAGSGEVESAQQEGPALQYAQVNCDARVQLKRPTSLRHESGAVSSLVPIVARRARRSEYPHQLARLSAGLSVPLRC